MRATFLILALTLGACAQFPELDGVISPDVENANFPTLIPFETFEAQAAPVVTNPIDTTKTLEARVASLRARAQSLQSRPIVDAATRRRIEDRLG
ncbi:hypothetical protein [uncultured Tateyamaria sp.]|uniref:hypothetical protein n=1 Tax=uncultured Tateyamaria sp. TaxID=455651 RepID=UPI002634E125|nr:hypothetical protein [uncultured Tateyamaria sp.]